MRNSKGVTLIVMVLAIVIIAIIIFVGMQHVNDYIAQQRIEDIKAAMLSIQGVVTNINNKHTVDEQTNALIGSKLDLENNTTGYNITEELKNSLLSVENTNLYILSQEELNNHGIKDIIINNNEFYVVDYNSGEIFYSLGINGKYKLSEM